MSASTSKGDAGSAPPTCQLLRGRITALADMPIRELQAAWSETWGAPPPKGARRRLLMLGIAWRWQAEMHGWSSKPLERRLAKVEAGSRAGGAGGGWSGSNIDTPALPRLMPGARLMRGWRNERHEVQVTEAGYLWRGKTHRSLSAIAREITGVRRNGPAFFGLREGEAL